MTFEGVSEMSEIFVDIYVRNTCVHVTFLCEVDACFLIQEVWPWASMLLLRVFMKVVCVCVCVEGRACFCRCLCLWRERV